MGDLEEKRELILICDVGIELMTFPKYDVEYCGGAEE